MKIILRKGNKTEGDKIIYIEANQEKISMIDLGAIINEFAINEFLIIDKKQKLSRKKHFWFGNLINKAIEDGSKNKDWFKLPLEELLCLKDYPYFVPENSILKFIKERKNEN